MTVYNEDYQKIAYACNGTTTTFPVTFDYTEEESIVVLLIDTRLSKDDPNYEVTLEDGIDYNIVSGDVETVETYSDFFLIGLERNTKRTQESKYKDFQVKPAATQENSVDILTYMVQELYNLFQYTLQYSIADTGSDTNMPTPIANSYLGYDEDLKLIARQAIIASSIIINDPATATYLRRKEDGSYDSVSADFIANELDADIVLGNATFATLLELEAGVNTSKPLASDVVNEYIDQELAVKLPKTIQCSPVYIDTDTVEVPVGAWALSADTKTYIPLSGQIDISSPVADTTYHLVTDTSGSMSFVRSEIATTYDLSFSSPDYIITRTGARDFTALDEGKYLEIGNKFIAKITEFISASQVKVDVVYSSLLLSQATSMQVVIHEARRLMSLKTNSSAEIEPYLIYEINENLKTLYKKPHSETIVNVTTEQIINALVPSDVITNISMTADMFDNSTAGAALRVYEIGLDDEAVVVSNATCITGGSDITYARNHPYIMSDITGSVNLRKTTTSANFAFYLQTRGYEDARLIGA